MRFVTAVWFLLALSLTAGSGYLWWYKAAEDAAHSPETFGDLVAMAATLCGVAGGFAWARAFRKIKE